MTISIYLPITVIQCSTQFNARGEATPSSDIDLRVDKGHLKGLIALGALYADLEDGLGKKLDLLTTESLDQQFLQHISGEEILIYYCIQN